MATKNIRGAVGGATADSENHSGQREGSHAFPVASVVCIVGFAFTRCAFANTQYRLHRVLSKCKHPLPIEARRALPLVLQHRSGLMKIKCLRFSPISVYLRFCMIKRLSQIRHQTLRTFFSKVALVILVVLILSRVTICIVLKNIIAC